MEHENPKYLLYFDLTNYQANEFATIKKLVKNIFNVRYYFLDIDIQFNEEIINYDAIKKDLSHNIMLLIGQIDDNLVDDIVYEINSLLGTDRVIRRRSVHDFNRTGYSDDQLNTMYQDFLEESEKLTCTVSDVSDELSALSQNFIYANLPYLSADHYLTFCKLFVNNANNLDSFEMLQDLNVCEALFKHFTYFLKYLSQVKWQDLIIYYHKDTLKILRNIRTFVKDSETSNDDIKEILLYKYILQSFNVNQFFYDPEEGFNQIRVEIEKVLEARKQALIDAFEERVHLFKDHYEIINISDPKTKTYRAYQKISANLQKYFEPLKPLLRAFRESFESPVKFNSKQHNPERNKMSLDYLKKYRIVKDYHEKYGNYTINIEGNEHIPFLQGKWFEYYTALVCQEIIENYRQQGYFPDYGIYQNVLVQIDGVKRELDIIIYLNGTIFYIENKIDSKNTYKNDLYKYSLNIDKMNINPNNCMLVYLEGEDRPFDKIKICNFNTFVTRFKKEVLKILEEDKNKTLAQQRAQEIALRAEQMMLKTLVKEKNSLYARCHYDEDEVTKFYHLVDKYKEEAKKLLDLNKKQFFDNLEVGVRSLKDDNLLLKFNAFKTKYQALYLSTIRKKTIDTALIKEMISVLNSFKRPELATYIECLNCLADEMETFLATGSKDIKTKFKILCEYGVNNPHYIFVLGSFLTSPLLLTASDTHYLVIAYLNRLNPKILNPKHLDELIKVIYRYIEISRNIIKFEIKNSRDAYLITRKEKEFISVLIYTVGMIYLHEFDVSGLQIDHNEEFLSRLSANPILYRNYINKTKLGKKLLPLNLTKKHFYEPSYLDLSSYLLLNYKTLKGEIKKMINCDEHLIFTIARTEQVGKMLKKLESSEIISGYKEIKKADLFIGIFKNQVTYDWFRNYCWVGIGLAFSSECSFDFTNANGTLNGEEVKIMFALTNKNVWLCLGKMVGEDLKLALVKTNFQNVMSTLQNLHEFNYNLENIKAECDRAIKKRE